MGADCELSIGVGTGHNLGAASATTDVEKATSDSFFSLLGQHFRFFCALRRVGAQIAGTQVFSYWSLQVCDLLQVPHFSGGYCGVVFVFRSWIPTAFALLGIVVWSAAVLFESRLVVFLYWIRC